MNFDQLLKEHVGVFGLFQILVLCVLCLDEVFIAFHVMGSVFLAATPDHWCDNPQIADIPALANCSAEEMLNLTIPWGKEGFESCSMYKRNYSALAGLTDFTCSSAAALAESLGNETETCTQWVYDTTKHADTVTTQWDFVCDNSWMRATVSSVYIAGMGVGGFIAAWFSDKFGRKKVILGAGLMNIVSSLGSTFSPIPAVYYFTRFFHAAFLMGSSTAMFVLGSEIVGPNWRVFMGATIFIVWAFAYMSLAGIAYAMRFYSWKDLNLILIVPEITYFILMFFFVPESPRWLYVNQRHKEADAIVKRMAKVNRATLPKVLDIVEASEEKSTTTVIDLFRTPNIRIMTLILAFNWAANGFIYYGLSLNTSDLGGNPYINFIIAGAVEIPAYVFQIWSQGKFGRIRPYAFSMILGGIVLLVTMTVPEKHELVIITLSMIGKFFISATFGMIWTYSPEAYPTCIRNQGLMTSALGARFASFLSPYIWLLAKVNRILPFLIYGASALLAGSLFFLLPETKDRALTQTIQEGEEAAVKYRIKLCNRSKNAPVDEEPYDKELKEPINREASI